MRKAIVFSFFLLFVSVVLIAGCSIDRDMPYPVADNISTPIADSPPKPQITLPLPPPAPNTIQMEGTIVSIDQALVGTNPKNPCSQAPCMATVRVDSIIAYGMASPVLSKNQEILVRFAFTLSDTKNLQINMNEDFSGLIVGSRFRASVVTLPEPYGNETESYVIYEYEKIAAG